MRVLKKVVPKVMSDGATGLFKTMKTVAGRVVMKECQLAIAAGTKDEVIRQELRKHQEALQLITLEPLEDADTVKLMEDKLQEMKYVAHSASRVFMYEEATTFERMVRTCHELLGKVLAKIQLQRCLSLVRLLGVSAPRGTGPRHQKLQEIALSSEYSTARGRSVLFPPA